MIYISKPEASSYLTFPACSSSTIDICNSLSLSKLDAYFLAAVLLSLILVVVIASQSDRVILWRQSFAKTGSCHCFTVGIFHFSPRVSVFIRNLCQTCYYTAISKKVAPVIHDAWSTFHTTRRTNVDSYCEREFQAGNK